jgi:hypothetical protein
MPKPRKEHAPEAGEAPNLELSDEETLIVFESAFHALDPKSPTRENLGLHLDLEDGVLDTVWKKLSTLLNAEKLALPAIGPNKKDRTQEILKKIENADKIDVLVPVKMNPAFPPVTQTLEATWFSSCADAPDDHIIASDIHGAAAEVCLRHLHKATITPDGDVLLTDRRRLRFYKRS